MSYDTGYSHSDRWIHFIVKLNKLCEKYNVQIACAQLIELTYPRNQTRNFLIFPGTFILFC